MDLSNDAGSAWNPGVGTGIPAEFRALETIFRPECVFSQQKEVEELAGLTGLPHEELTVFRPQRLALHELIIRVTADIAVAEGEEEETFGHNFRRIARTIWDQDIAPHMGAIEQTYAELRQQAADQVRQILADTLFPPPAAPVPGKRRGFPFGLFGRTATAPPPRGSLPAAGAESAEAREHRVIAEFKAAGLATDDPLRKAVYRSLYRMLGAIAVKRGRLGADQELLARLVSQHVGNHYGAQRIGQLIAPLFDAAIQREAYARTTNRPAPQLISLKGAAAAGKSSLRPMIKQVMREQGIEADGYATISPDVWRRLLLDYEALGPAYKYAGHLTSRELIVIDGKLDRYIRFKAARDHAIPHFLVDRFRFDSFSGEQVARILHNTYARYVDTMLMYFIVTPPEETVERGWLRALERGRYKAVEDFLGHSVEAYSGMPKILFKWLAHQRPDYRYFFLDNRVPKGTFPTTIALGNQHRMTIYDPLSLIDIERYQKINIHAVSRDQVYPSNEDFSVAANAGFLKEILRRIPQVDFVDRPDGNCYARCHDGRCELLDATVVATLPDAVREVLAVVGV
ncbi:MAG TPA: hypothetical protein VFH22_10195, partial [Rhodocyclaceae bacterium]|nr:hypothetical protein [Rhodocyclaceae bacterium]